MVVTNFSLSVLKWKWSEGAAAPRGELLTSQKVRVSLLTWLSERSDSGTPGHMVWLHLILTMFAKCPASRRSKTQVILNQGCCRLFYVNYPFPF